jgi:hypothetical protein
MLLTLADSIIVRILAFLQKRRTSTLGIRGLRNFVLYATLPRLVCKEFMRILDVHHTGNEVLALFKPVRYIKSGTNYRALLGVVHVSQVRSYAECRRVIRYIHDELYSCYTTLCKLWSLLTPWDAQVYGASQFTWATLLRHVQPSITVQSMKHVYHMQQLERELHTSSPLSFWRGMYKDCWVVLDMFDTALAFDTCTDLAIDHVRCMMTASALLHNRLLDDAADILTTFFGDICVCVDAMCRAVPSRAECFMQPDIRLLSNIELIALYMLELVGSVAGLPDAIALDHYANPNFFVYLRKHGVVAVDATRDFVLAFYTDVHVVVRFICDDDDPSRCLRNFDLLAQLVDLYRS